jgi:hypothetical protein
VTFEPSVQFDIEQAGNIKTALFGGEGLFFAVLRGPGKIWLQSLPFSRLAGRMLAVAPQRGGSREEGSESVAPSWAEQPSAASAPYWAATTAKTAYIIKSLRKIADSFIFHYLQAKGRSEVLRC